MSITTYSALKTAIADFLNRDDLAATVPTFISLAEADINRRVRHWRMENRATATLDGRYEALPPRFLAPIRLSVTGDKIYQLKPAGQSAMLDLRSQSADQSGRPEYYALTKGELEFFPTPSDDYSLEMVYYEGVEPLSDSVATNWLLTNYPDVYLYGSLVHTAPYLNDDQRTQVWAAFYQSAVDALDLDDQAAKFGGVGLQMKIRSY